MSQQISENLTRIAVFYDGNFFAHVSDFYAYAHARRARISVHGLHEFIRDEVSRLMRAEFRLCQIVDAHYFRGRYRASLARDKGIMIYYERVFDDILMTAGVTTHYLPLKSSGGRWQEKGIDVLLALEAFELSIHKNFSVVVLIAGDSDYVPLIKKLNTLGIRVMLLSWDIQSMNELGRDFSTRTSQDLLDAASYPISMHTVINEGLDNGDELIDALFVPTIEPTTRVSLEQESEIEDKTAEIIGDQTPGESFESRIFSIKAGYGFIEARPNNIFFHYTDLMDVDFNDLSENDAVTYEVALNDRGEPKAIKVRPI
ncbi:MAG: NYN domain-containing protein [Cryomorphaceae bacterium]|nr:NYN domain-containing protein [Cryomorphaceae bacterium]